MCLAIVSVIVSGDAQVSYWPIVTVPEVFAKLNSAPEVPFWFLKWRIKDLPCFPFVKNSQFKANSILLGQISFKVSLT